MALQSLQGSFLLLQKLHFRHPWRSDVFAACLRNPCPSPTGTKNHIKTNESRNINMQSIEGTFIAPQGKFALVVGRFNSFVVESLVSGAVDALVRHGVKESDITIIRAPGAFEIPLVTQKVAQRGEFAAIIALGAVIRGGTPHFEYVAGECTKGLAQVSMEYGVPVAFGVLTVDSIEQAIERSGTKAGNKGAEAALSALEMVSLLGALEAK